MAYAGWLQNRAVDPAEEGAKSSRSQFLRRRGLENSRLIGAGRPGVLPCRGGCIATTQFLFRVSHFLELWGRTDEDYRGVQKPPPPSLRNYAPDSRRPHDSEQPLAPQSATPGQPRARPRMLPARPRARSHPHGGRPRSRVLRKQGLELLRGARGGSSRHWDEPSEDAAARGASPPSVHQSPDASEIRLWVCGERNATQTPCLPNPAQINTHKHSHRRRRGPRSQRRVLATGDQGRARDPPGAAARDRPRRKCPAIPARLNGATADLGPASPGPGSPGRRGAQAGREPGRESSGVICPALLGTAAWAGRRPGGGLPQTDLPGRGALADSLRSLT